MAKEKPAAVDTKEEVKLDPSLTSAPSGAASLAEIPKAPLENEQAKFSPPPEREDTGFEHMTADDFMVPFLTLLQAKSPQAEEGNPKKIEGAKAGAFMNSVSNAIFLAGEKDAGIKVIPVHSIHQYLEWIPRDDGGGLQGVYDWQDPFVVKAKQGAGKKFGKMKVNDGNDLVETFNVFCLQVMPNGDLKRIVLGFSSSQIGAYKKWMTNAQEQTKEVPGLGTTSRPLWSHRYVIRTVFNQNKKGTWFKMDVQFDGPNAEAARYADDDATQVAAKEFRKLLLAGVAKADFNTATQGEEAEVEGEYTM